MADSNLGFVDPMVQLQMQMDQLNKKQEQRNAARKMPSIADVHGAIAGMSAADEAAASVSPEPATKDPNIPESRGLFAAQNQAKIGAGGGQGMSPRDAAMMLISQGAQPRSVSTAGIEQAQRNLHMQTAIGRTKMQQASDDFGAATAAYTEAEGRAIEERQKKKEKADAARQVAFDEYKVQEIAQSARRRAFDMEKEKRQKAIDDEELMAQYPLTDLSPDQIRRFQNTLKDTESTEDERAAANKALNDAQTVEPMRDWGLKRLGAAIAVAMGAFGAAMTKTPNYAQKIIDREIENTIQNQRQKMRDAKSRARDRKTQLEKYIDNFRDEEIAKYQLMNRMYKLSMDEADMLEAKIGTKEAKAQNDKLQAHGQQKIAENQQKIAEAENRLAISAGNVALQGAVSEANIESQNEARRQAAEQQKAAFAINRFEADKKNAIQGLQKIEGKRQDPKKAADLWSRKAAAIKAIDEMITTYEKYGVGERLLDVAKRWGTFNQWKSVLGKDLRVQGGGIFNVLRADTGSGAHLTEREMLAIDPTGILQNPDQWVRIGGLEELKAIRRRMTTTTDPLLQGYGYRTVQAPPSLQATE